MLVSKNGKRISNGEGLFFQFPSSRKYQKSFEDANNAPLGWSTCSNGFAMFSREIAALGEARLILFGLKVTGVGGVGGRSEGLSIRTKTEDIEGYVKNILASFLEINYEFLGFLKNNAHEIRNINTDIQHAAQEIIYMIEGGGQEEQQILTRTQNIKGLSEILTTRLNFLEFISEPKLEEANKGPRPPFKKFHKTKLSLEDGAKAKGIEFVIEGYSIGKIYALPVFDIIPYLIIQNAIKYTPPNLGNYVAIKAEEDEKEITFVVKNLGPKIHEFEKDRIFLSGFRGEEACAVGIEGSGVGLFLLKELVEKYHDGKIELVQSEEKFQYKGRPYCETKVTVSFPRVD